MADPCLLKFVCQLGTCYLMLYVEDVAIIGSKMAVAKLKRLIQEGFQICETDESKHYLGIRITQTTSPRTITLDQEEYSEELLKSLRMSDAKPLRVPIVERLHSRTEAEGQFDSGIYRSAVGKLNWLNVSTRPDIAFTCRELAKNLADPSPRHWTAVKTLAKYLRGTTFALKFEDKGKPWVVEGYSDSDWAGDDETRRSVGGYTIFFAGNLIAWKSQGQQCVARSSCEAEVIAITELVSELLYLRQVTDYLGLTKPETQSTSLFSSASRVSKNSGKPVEEIVKLYGDNQASLKLLASSTAIARTKHMDVKYKFILQRSRDHNQKLGYVRTNEMVADVMTKPLGAAQHHYLLNKMR